MKKVLSKSFSLIELLITLIILSLLMAAFIPLITKKLKANDVTVGSFGNGSVGIKRNVTKEDCDKLNAVYVPASETMPKPLCVLKYNIGDMGNENWAGVQKCQAGDANCKVEMGDKDNETVTENELQPTCWQGTTGNSDYCNNAFGGYDGCTRTLCNFTGAKKMCSNYYLNGTSGWRLPTMSELTSFTNDTYSSKDKGAEGLMFCDYSTGTTVAPMCNDRDKSIGACVGSYDGNCYPSHLWSSSLLLGSSSQAQNRTLNATWHDYQDYLGIAFSTRCVLDGITDTVATGNSSGFEVGDNQLNSQDDCDRLGAGLLFVSKKYTKTKNMCVTKYNIGDMKNEVWTGVQKCDASDTNCKVEGGGKDVVSAQDTLQPTCWQGNTADPNNCNSKFGGYDGCTRTVCNWTGAKRMCENYRLGTYGWRLPTMEELKSFTNDTFSSESKGVEGLMFCKRALSSDFAPKCLNANWCTGSYYGSCDAYFLWSSGISANSKSQAQDRHLETGWANMTHDMNAAFSARCVLDEDAFKNAFTNKVMPTETEFSSSSCDVGCALCAKDKCYACKKGYSLVNNKCTISIANCEQVSSDGKCLKCKNNLIPIGNRCVTCETTNGLKPIGNLCVTQYNIGDGDYGESWQGVKRCAVGHACYVENGESTSVTKDNLTPACWQGNTSTDGKCNADFGGYSGCNRTVCNWTGGKKMCENIGWRLPTMNELTTLTDSLYSNETLAKTGLMFCDHSSTSTIAPMCNYRDNSLGACVGSYSGRCHPHGVWSSSMYLDSTSLAQLRYLDGTWHDSKNFLGLNISVRCVKDL